VLLEYRKVDEQISTDMEKDHRTCISQKNTEEKSLKRASFLTFISSKITITQSNGGRLKNYFK